MRDMLEGLNPEQREAVTTVNGALLVIAGAGTGKTSVLIRRVAYLIERVRVPPQEILVVTFTQKAAAEIKRRLEDSIGMSGEDLWAGTFHSFCADILRQHAERLGLPGEFHQFVKVDQWIFLRRLLPQLNLDYFLELSDPYRVIYEFVEFIGRAKDELIFPEEYIAYAQQKQREFNETHNVRFQEITKFLREDKYINTRPSAAAHLQQAEWLTLKKAGLEVKKMLEIGEIYRRYQEAMMKAGCLDFGDLIFHCYRLLKENSDIRGMYQERFRHILVDEFQDTNIAQIELLRLLAEPRRNICVVGDDDQAIYRFRGASYASFVRFKDLFPDFAVVKLYQNYRSTQRILKASGHLIEHNAGARYDPEKNLWTEKEEGEFVKLFVSSEFTDEAAAIADVVQEQVGRLPADQKDYGKFAVLYRAHAHRELITKEFDRRKIPYETVPAEDLVATDVVQEVFSFLQTVRNRKVAGLKDTLPLMKILSLPRWKVPVEELVKLFSLVDRQRVSIYDLISGPSRSRQGVELGTSLQRVTKGRLSELNGVIEQIAEMVEQGRSVLEIVEFIISQSEYNIASLQSQDTREAEQVMRAISGLLRFVQEKTEHDQNRSFLSFAEYLDFFIEAGGEIQPVTALEMEQPWPNFPISGDGRVNAVKCMTVHAAKGLEFDTVFLVGLTNSRFPTRRRSETVKFPPELLKEVIPSGDVHRQEERRLFYVAMTRAQLSLYLSAIDKKGNRKSRFVEEAGAPDADYLEYEMIAPRPVAEPPDVSARVQPSLFPIPEKLRLSFSQIETYRTCPLKYKFRYIYRIPTPPKAYFVYGEIQHRVLEAFFSKIKRGEEVNDDTLRHLYEQRWREGGFVDTLQQVEYKKRGYSELQEFYDRNKEILKEPLALEEEFRISIGGHKVTGRIDRIDKLDEESVEVIDYKTGKPRGQDHADQSMQLSIYAIAVRERFQKEPKHLSFYYLTNNEKVTSARTEKELESAKDSMLEVAEEILGRNFQPNKGFHCDWCEFKPICPVWNTRGIN
ncbi:MAG: ATP-dependent helicase [Bacteroidota bacterium]